MLAPGGSARETKQNQEIWGRLHQLLLQLRELCGDHGVSLHYSVTRSRADTGSHREASEPFKHPPT